MENVYREANFYKYCRTCKYKDLDEKFDPCNDCLAEGVNVDSEKPVYWKEADK